ncbi:MAG: hypothetical protein R3E96_05530 [Planctomycetota bacterium]
MSSPTLFDPAETEVPKKQRKSKAKAEASTEAESTPTEAPAPEAPQGGGGGVSKARDISVAEFFGKNRHMLGFDSPTKALLMAVKEAVDNGLDTCEEATGILPDITVRDHPHQRKHFPDGGRGQRPRHPRYPHRQDLRKLLYGSSSTSSARAAASRASASPAPACTAS